MATSESQNSSSSSSEFKGRYDIFLSFRGLDTRKKFTDHLYHALMLEGFQTFRDDDEINRGDVIKPELQKAIANSRTSVIVLSKNYANSTACLLEVETILKQCKKYDHFVLPVFYEVDPGEIKEQAKKLNFGEKRVTVEQVEGWSAALKEIASMAGMVSQNQSNGYEADFIEEIVGELKSKLVGNHLRVGDHLVSMDLRTKRVTSWLKDWTTRNLLTIENEKLQMHQLLQDMGKQIVCRESDYPEERSKIWCSKESFDILFEKIGTNKIKGLVLDMNVLGNSNNVVFEANTFEKMYNLRLLKLSAVQLSGSYKSHPKRLRWLYWHGFPSESFPNDFPLENLVALDMQHGNLKQVWKGTKVLGLMKILNLSHSPKLVKTPDFSRIPNLEKLALKACPSLIEVDESFVELQRIELLDLKDCKNLRKLPKNIGMVESLVEIDISGCSNLMGVMEELEKMKSLQVLKASGLRNITRVHTMEDVSQASICPWVPKPIQMSFASLPSSLVKLELSNCNLTEDAFPRDLKLSKLESLSLAGNPISSLPNFIKDNTSLRILSLINCSKLQQILWPSTSFRTLIANKCDALEKITFETGFSFGIILRNHCRKLYYIPAHFKISPVREVDVELLNSIGFFNLDSMADVEAKLMNPDLAMLEGDMVLFDVVPIQILYQDYAFHTFFPGREVPQWFIKKNGGSSISFTMTLSPHFGCRGLNLCAVYTFSDDYLDRETYTPFSFSYEISSKRLCRKTVFYIWHYGIPEKGGDMVWLSHCFKGNLFADGDEVEVSFCMNTSSGHFKECGVHLLYFEEPGEVLQHISTLQRSWDPSLSIYEHNAEEPGVYEDGVYTVRYNGRILVPMKHRAPTNFVTEYVGGIVLWGYKPHVLE